MLFMFLPVSIDREIKCCAFPDCPLCPRLSAVPVDDPPDVREPYAGSLELLRRMKTLEHPEELVLYRMSNPTPLSLIET